MPPTDDESPDDQSPDDQSIDDQSGDESSPTGTAKNTLRSADALAAVANPARGRIIDVLSATGPGTASSLGEATGLAVGSVSHHLKVLAGAGIVEPAPEMARDRRERWWRLVTGGFRWSTPDFADDPVGAAAESAAAHHTLQHQLERTRDWLALDPADAAVDGWSAAAFATQTWLTLTPAETTRLAGEIEEVLARWHAGEDDRRRRDDRPDARPVLCYARAFPSTP